MDSASNGNEYLESFLGVKRWQRVTLTASLPSVSQLSRKSGCLDVSELYGPPRPVKGIALLFFTCVLVVSRWLEVLASLTGSLCLLAAGENSGECQRHESFG
jgi:hypothetical protein